MSANFYELLKYAATGIASPSMTYYDKMRASTLMGGAVQTLTGIPPLSFKADGKPLISWSMKGNGQQQGTPTPDNPVMPTFCGVRTVNICAPAEAETKTSNGITVVSNGSGTYHVSGTATADAGIRFDVQSFLIPKSIGSGGSGTYSMFNSATYDNADVKIAFYYQETKIDDWGLTVRNRTTTIYSTMSGKDCDAIVFTVKSGVTVDFTISPEFTNDGVLPTEFEPYGWKIPLTCAQQTTPVYLGEVPTVRRVKKLVLTGEENIANTGGNAPFSMVLANTGKYDGASIVTWKCSHYEAVPNNASWATYDSCISVSTAQIISGTIVGLRFRDTSCATVDAFKQFLADQYTAGTPVVIWYVLAEPETAIVNEPLAKIGYYCDELHSEDAGVTIPTAKGSNTLSVDTTVQPSEMTIKYR